VGKGIVVSAHGFAVSPGESLTEVLLGSVTQHLLTMAHRDVLGVQQGNSGWRTSRRDSPA
jgi:hypothetical protein